MTNSDLHEQKETKDKVLFYSKLVINSFNNAAKKNYLVEKYYNIGGYNFKLSFAGNALVPYLTPALTHLELNHIPDDFFLINIWDSNSTDSEFPNPLWEINLDIESNERWGFHRNDIIGLYKLQNKSFQLFNKTERKAFYHLPSISQIDFADVASPLRTIFNWFFKEKKRQLVHGAAIAYKNKGILLVGHNNAGKSSTALNCIENGFDYIGDDNILISTNNDNMAFSLYNTAKLFENDFQYFPQLRKCVNNLADNIYGKSLMFLDNLFFEQLKYGFEIKAVVIPNITNKEITEIRPISPSKSLLMLAPNSIFFLNGNHNSSLSNIAEFIKKVPNFILNLGKNRNNIASILKTMISKIDD